MIDAAYDQIKLRMKQDLAKFSHRAVQVARQGIRHPIATVKAIAWRVAHDEYTGQSPTPQGPDW